MNTATPESLVHMFTPLYSYQLPAWWQTQTGMLLIAVGSILASALIGYGIWYRWWYKPPLTLAQWCTKELQALKVLLERRPIQYKRFFGAATFFFKQFLVKHYGWNVLDKTDEELWVFLEQKPEIPVSLHPAIKELLSYAQIIKFADTQALAENAADAQRYLADITTTLQKEAVHAQK